MNIVNDFSGGGVADFGFAPHKVVGAVDIDKWACEAHALNHGRGIAVQRDLLDPVKGKPIDVVNAMGIQQCDVLWCSTPCTPWSSAKGRRRHEFDLVMLTLLLPPKYAKILNPKHIVIENVPALLRPMNKIWVKWLLNDLKKLGYNVTEQPWELDALQFGGCQRRKRVIFVASKGKLPKPPVGTGKKLKLGEVIGGLEDKLEAGCMPMSESWRKKIAKVKPGEPLSDMNDDPRLDMDDYCPPLRTAPCIKNVPIFAHPTRDRFLSVQEYAHIMGCPTYKFPNAMRTNDRYRMVGQGVTPNMAAAIINALE